MILLPFSEQLEIISQVEDRFSRMVRITKDIDKQLINVEKNKQSILAPVFSRGLQ